MDGVQVSWMRLWASDDATALARVRDVQVREVVRTESRYDDAAVAAQAPVWCGGMVESGIGRLANVHLQTLPGFTLPGDTSASLRVFEEDLVDPPVEVMKDGTIAVPEGPAVTSWFGGQVISKSGSGGLTGTVNMHVPVLPAPM